MINGFIPMDHSNSTLITLNYYKNQIENCHNIHQKLDNKIKVNNFDFVIN